MNGCSRFVAPNGVLVLVASLLAVGGHCSMLRGQTRSSHRGTADGSSAPNIVFLIVESTDGRTWQRGYQDDVIPLPNIRYLQERGTSFYRHYSNTPVCCPSRATIWSGKHAHHIRHEHNGFDVKGAWNNYEGLPLNYADRIDQILAREAGYNVKLSGKEDWVQGAHSLNVQLNAWTMYTQFPYNISENGGWRDETDDCRTNGTVLPGSKSAHKFDWETLNDTVSWIRENASSSEQPFFVYQGMNIVHPPYATSEYWYDQIDPDRIDVPQWKNLSELHPCDLQSSMLKGCTPSTVEADDFYDWYRRRNIRRIYYAMIAEFDAMVGEYIRAIEDAGVMDNTIFIVTSDHGDMQMEHQQHYKMTPYDASASVPLVIFDGRIPRSTPEVVDNVTQLIDLFPTIMQYAGIAAVHLPNIDGYPLQPLMSAADHTAKDVRSPFVVSQFHGCNIAMSWFLVVQNVDTSVYKLVVYGTGEEVPSQLFDLSRDPGEMDNLIDDEQYASVKTLLTASLRSVVDFPSVARNVAHYNKESFRFWMHNVTNWRSDIHSPDLRWTESWNAFPVQAFEAVRSWLESPLEVLGCRASVLWPPSSGTGDAGTGTGIGMGGSNSASSPGEGGTPVRSAPAP